MAEVATFSIVAYDPVHGEWGVAVRSRLLMVGAVVPWAEAGVGCLATQAAANVSYGPRGLALLRSGLPAAEVVAELLKADEGRDYRQLAVVGRGGDVFAYTGRHCPAEAAHVVGPGFACQGSALSARQVVEAMADAFAKAKGELAERLLAALVAGERAERSRARRLSAALLVVRAEGGYGHYTDRAIDLRVDDHPRALAELVRLLGRYRLYYGTPRLDEQLRIHGELARELALRLARLGFYRGPEVETWTEALADALEAFHEEENLEGRIVDPRYVDRRVLAYLRELTSK